jgi:hypothetical protein
MLKPVKEAFLKHDLYKLVVDPVFNRTFTLEDVSQAQRDLQHKKVASKGLRFVYCETDRRDAKHGWYADDKSGRYLEGNCGFGKMSEAWVKQNLTDPVPLEGTKFRDCWGTFEDDD